MAIGGSDAAGGEGPANAAATASDQNVTIEAQEIEAICLDERASAPRARALAAMYFALLFDDRCGLPARELRALHGRDLELVMEALQQYANGYAFRGSRQAEMARVYGDVVERLRFEGGAG